MLAAGVLATGCASTPAAPETDTPQPSVQPPRDLLSPAASIRDDTVELLVNADVGRVVFFGRPGGDNLLWLDPRATEKAYASRHGRTWANWGGDKVWVAFQNMWPRIYPLSPNPWPPDGIIDGGAWTLLVHAPDTLVIESRMNPELGVVARRRFELLGDGEVLITNTLTRRHASPFPVMIWSVTQTLPPDAVMMEVAPDRPPATPRVAIWDQPHADERWQDLAAGRVVQWLAPDEKARKTGSLGRGIAATYGNQRFLQAHAFDPRAAFPDAANVHLYHQPGNYTELELLSPEVQLAPGQTLTHRVLWRLEDEPGHQPEATAQRLIEFIGHSRDRLP